MTTRTAPLPARGGFSDGSSASGVELRVETARGRILLKGEMSENSAYTFDKPAIDFTVVFDAGQGHLVEVHGREISQ